MLLAHALVCPSVKISAQLGGGRGVGAGCLEQGGCSLERECEGVGGLRPLGSEAL